jgi:cytochrome c biogenesis protein CcmG/thiol:disulfide interchange protein DsbE
MRSLHFLAVVAALYSSFALSNQPQEAPGATHANSVKDRFRGKRAPEFELNLIGGKGKTLKLSDFEGKGVVVNFWATWCGPCKIEMPWLVRLQKKYRARGLQIVGVAMDKSPERSISSFANKMRVNYPIVRGTDQVAARYGGVEGLPELFFVDRSGTIVRHHVGLVSQSVIESNINDCLSSGKPAAASPH